MSKLTLEAAAQKMREAVKDNSYRGTPLGHEVAKFLRGMNASGRAHRSRYEYESVLYRFALHFADLELEAFQPPAGVDLIETYIEDGWGHTAPGTRAKLHSVLSSFFKWHHVRGRINGNPMAIVERPKVPKSQRQAHHPHEVLEIIRAQELGRDRCGVLLLAKMGLRKNELRELQINHIDLERGVLRLHQKGGDYVYHPIVFPDVVRELADHLLVDAREADEYLLYPRWELPQPDGSTQVMREVKSRPMSLRAVHEWWARCLRRANIKHFPMHELRHTAGTEFHRAVHDLELTRQFMRHASITTTSGTYLHLDDEDLRRGMLAAATRWEDAENQKGTDAE